MFPARRSGNHIWGNIPVSKQVQNFINECVDGRTKGGRNDTVAPNAREHILPVGANINTSSCQKASSTQIRPTPS